VVGYDDTGPASWLNPPLTTIHQPVRGMAEEATALAIALARGETPARTRIVLATELVLRASTAARTDRSPLTRSAEGMEMAN
jgi:DNA-binding LacI/PurR family transcriptional regulator